MRTPPKNKIILYAFILLLNAYAFAQKTPYVAPAARWIDQEIIFLPIDTSEFDEPYKNWSTSKFRTIIPVPSSVYLKKAIITDVQRDDSFDPYFVIVKLVDSGTILYGISHDGHLKDVGFMEEYESASKFIGAILWNARSTFYSYDSVLNIQMLQAVTNLEPLYLWDIEWGKESERPIRIFLFEPEKRKIFYDLSFSVINFSPKLEPVYIDDLFHKMNPRLIYPNWKDRLWEKIETETISKRMSKEAVLLSWGSPIRTESKKVDDDLIETWSYDRTPFVTVTFKNGILSGWGKAAITN